ncbi:r-phenyllactate dehydratase small subunit [Desulfosarcina ovata subsp. sediminis]|uniref:R-phenyllactate dehydratase small subunit n=1 Tax=Desulfosarcina ovata subsp. sediminis TaxID=885957 RepID=A0A5K7ZL70_9BACT|nr:2-hydroxyacyl-CoA dehydratase [Desulfosarcina ovata]BBO81005.1 r-phenyllactate dehydratase small subunit [Desulfosarcina ovata subsp. sediminis]
MIEQFDQWYDDRVAYARQWKENTGGKVVGYLCTYVPEEIFYAAKVLPIRILGGHAPQSVTEPHLFAMYCPFCRDVLAQGIQGKYDFIDGIVIAQSCLHIRQSFYSWQKHRPRDFSYILPMPQGVQNKDSLPYLTNEYIKFKRAVEQWLGYDISQDELAHGIDVVNRNRRLLKEAYALRKSDNPPLTGLEAMGMVLSSQLVDKNEHNAYLQQALENGLKTRLTDRDPGARLMIIGSEDDDMKFIDMVETQGSTIVCDDHCTGSRYFWNEVEPGEDLLQAIAKRYIDRTPCPSKDWPQRRRFDTILDFAKDYRIDGAIIVQQKFCDPHELDKVALLDTLEKSGIKTLCLEFDVTVPLGPMRIRVDAFLETLAGDDLF